MESVRRRVAACFPEGFPDGVLPVDVVIAPEGFVEDILIPESIPDTQTDCVEGAVNQARFRQIAGDHLQVLYPYAEPGAHRTASDESPETEEAGEGDED